LIGEVAKQSHAWLISIRAKEQDRKIDGNIKMKVQTDSDIKCTTQHNTTQHNTTPYSSIQCT
jgi:hypothetical protein